LLDTGSQLNILPKSYVPDSIKINKTDISAKNYSGGSVAILGYVEAKFSINNEIFCEGCFYIVDSCLEPILGSEALAKNEILINLARKRIIQNGPIQRHAEICSISSKIPNIDGVMEDGLFAYSTENHTFRGKSEQIIDLKIDGIQCHKNLFFDESLIPGSKLEIVQSYQSVDPENPFFRVLVINPLNSTIRIPGGTKFARLAEKVKVAQLKQDNKNVDEILNHVKIGSVSTEIYDKFVNLLKEYSFLFQTDEDTLPVTELEEFVVETENEHPISSHPYRTPLALRDEMKKILESFVDQGIIEKCNSPYNSPCLLVKKKNGKFRLVIDYRRLNSITKQQHHPIQQIEDVLCYLEESKYFSCCDLKKGFHQVKVAEESRAKLAFSNEWGQFTYKSMPMGTRNAPMHFAKCIDFIFRDTPKSEVCAYLDDLICHSKTPEDHLNNLSKFFLILSQNNLRINIDKASFFQKEASILGFIVGSGNIRPSIEKIETIRNLQIPNNRDQALSLFGALSQHRKFISNFAQIGLEITKTYRGTFQWTDEATASLEKLKNIICNRTLELKIPPLKDAVFVLETDASKDSFGGVLFLCVEQNRSHSHDSKCLRPCAYHSLNFTPTQLKYGILEKELLAGKICMERWKVYLAYVEFLWITDNSCLKFANSFKSSNNKIMRWICEIQGFNFKIEQRKTHQMKISDFLSRNPALGKVNKISFNNESFVDFQKNDVILKQIRNFVSLDRWPNNPDPEIIPFFFHRENLVILETGELVLKSGSTTRFCVPRALIGEIISEHHESSHFGIDITFKMIMTKYFWPNLKKDIIDFVRTCSYCQTSKYNTHPNRAPLGKFKTPSGPFEMIAIDLIGPLPITDQDNLYIFTAIDGFSKKAYGLPLSNKVSGYLLEKFKQILFQNPKFPRFVLLDNAPEFNKISKFLRDNGIEPHFIPPRHPSTNGLCENLNRTIKARLRAKTNFENWDVALFQIIHEINCSSHSVLGTSPFIVETGVLETHNFFDPNWRNYGDRNNINLEYFREKIELEKNKRVSKFDNPNFKEYNLNDKVLIKNFRSKFPPYIGPFLIKHKSESGSWYTCVNNDKEFRRHADDLRVFNERVSNLETPSCNQKNVLTTRQFHNFQNFQEACSDEGFFNTVHEPTSDTNEELLLPNGLEIDNSETTSDKRSPTHVRNRRKLDFDLSNSSCSTIASVSEMMQDLQENELYENLEQNPNSPDSTSTNSTDFFTESVNRNPTNLDPLVALRNFPENPETEIIEENTFGTSDPTPHLLSYDKLPNEITGKTTDNFGSKRQREKSDDSITSRKFAKFSLENNLENMSILIKFPEDDSELFSKIDDKWENIANAENEHFQNGVFLKIGELNRNSLRYILFKMNKNFSSEENISSLRLKIRSTIQHEYPDWRKSASNQLLFFAIFKVQKERSLFDLSLPELKALIATFELPFFRANSKTALTAYIEKEFSTLYPHHPRRNNELIFLPENETEI
jgi:hypothetical protein